MNRTPLILGSLLAAIAGLASATAEAASPTFINLNMPQFSTVGFYGEAVGGFSAGSDENDCYDPAEIAGGSLSPSGKCIKGITSPPVAAVRVVSCFDKPVTDATRQSGPCGDPGFPHHQTDAMYMGLVGAQQFGRAQLRSGTLAPTDTNVDAILKDVTDGDTPSKAYWLPQGGGPYAFASPVATRFRLPPVNIPDLVACLYPAVAGETYDLGKVGNGFIFVDDAANHFGSSAHRQLADRFKCPDAADLATITQDYLFDLRDNTGQALDTDWTFSFTDPGAAEATVPTFRIYEPLRDVSGLQPDLMAGRSFLDLALDDLMAVPGFIDNVNPCAADGLCPLDHDFRLTRDGVDPAKRAGFLDISLPSEFTRIAAMTVLGESLAGATDWTGVEQPITAGFAELRDIVLYFKGPVQDTGDTAESFPTEPFNLRFEINPSAPSVTADPAAPAGTPTTGVTVRTQGAPECTSITAVATTPGSYNFTANLAPNSFESVNVYWSFPGTPTVKVENGTSFPHALAQGETARASVADVICYVKNADGSRGARATCDGTPGQIRVEQHIPQACSVPFTAP